MAWTGTITLDKDKDDVGTLGLVWNEGQADEYRHPGERCKMDARGIIAVAKNAKAAQKAHAAKVAKTDALLAKVLAKLNATA